MIRIEDPVMHSSVRFTTSVRTSPLHPGRACSLNDLWEPTL